MAKRKPVRRKADPPPDDTCEPALLTPRRMAGELERITLDVARAQLRLRRLGAYVDSQSFPALAEALGDVVDGLGELSGRVLIGDVAIVAGRDEAAGRDRYPLLEGIKPQVANIATYARVGTEAQLDGPGTPQDESAPGPVPTPRVSLTKAARAKGGADKSTGKFQEGGIRIVAVKGPDPDVLAAMVPEVGRAVNEVGVFVNPEVLEIPGFTKSSKCAASVRLGRGDDGLWRSAYSYEMPLDKGGRGSGLPNVHQAGHKTRDAAILSITDLLIGVFKRNGHAKAVAAVETFAADFTRESDIQGLLIDDVEQLLELESDADGAEETDWPDPAPALDDPDDDLPTDWESVPLDQLELPSADAEQLQDLGITTAGRLAEWVHAMERLGFASADDLSGMTTGGRESVIHHAREELERIRPGSDPQPRPPKPKSQAGVSAKLLSRIYGYAKEARVS